MKVVLIGLLLVFSAYASFTVDIDRQNIDDAQYVKFVSGSGQYARWVSQAAPVQKDADQVFTFSPKIDDESTRVVFDTTVGENWKYVSEATPAISGSNTVAAADGRALLIKSEDAELKKVSFGKVHLKDVKVQKSNTINPSGNPQVFKAAQIGFALNRQYQTNFFHSLQKNKVRLENNGRGFSFYFSSKINQIFFGLPQKFFASEDLETLDAKNANNNPNWVIAVKNKGISLKGMDELQYTDPTYALFDTTTRFIWAADNLVDQIVAKLNTNGLNCQDVSQTHYIGVYECSEGTFPELQIQFLTNDTRDSEESRVYTLKNYVQKIGNDKVRLLIRKAAQYQNTTATVRVPATVVGTAKQNLLVLGTIFQENVYTYFSYDSHTVQLAHAFKVVPSAMQIDSTWRIWFLVLASIATIGALAYIISVMKPVPYEKSTQQALPQSLNRSNVYAPQQGLVQTSQYPMTQQQIVQAPIVSNSQAPQYYVQQGSVNQSQLSPARVIKSYAPQGYYHQH